MAPDSLSVSWAKLNPRVSLDQLNEDQQQCLSRQGNDNHRVPTCVTDDVVVESDINLWARTFKVDFDIVTILMTTTYSHAF